MRQCQQLYDTMLQDTGLTGSRPSYSPGWVEHGFRISAQAARQLQKILDTYTFTNGQEEHWFFKTLQPQFTGLVEYFRLIYTAELFVSVDPAKGTEYWNRELGKTWQFLMKYESFYLGYKKGQVPNDPAYNNDLLSYSNLAAMIVAREKYMEYIQQKLVGPYTYSHTLSHRPVFRTSSYGMAPAMPMVRLSE